VFHVLYPKDPRMGGLFRAPQPVEIAPPPPQQQQQAQQAVAQAQAQVAIAAEAEATEARRTAAARARRGPGGTIATSARGVLAPLPTMAIRKTLLGE
jgi:hypothetical protein